ncbi:MAG: transposase [Sphingobacteriales bacterium]|nr:transposase [Sphingobacteriales bacterium]
MYYDTQRKLALFDYQLGRGALYPKAMLHKFKGYLQTDGYDAYETFDKVEGVTLLLLGASRRKFYEAKDYDKANADAVLSLIQDLYKIESYCRDENFTPEQIKTIGMNMPYPY